MDELQFSKHYTREEAEALLPQIRQWLVEIGQVRTLLEEEDGHIQQRLRQGEEFGGETVNRHLRHLVQIKDLLREFQAREIQIKDMDRGLIDFPAFVGGKEVFLCWEQDEDHIEFWHDLDTGYAGREPL